MADVKIVDIDNVQWNMKDQEARNRIAKLENDFYHIKEIRRIPITFSSITNNGNGTCRYSGVYNFPTPLQTDNYLVFYETSNVFVTGFNTDTKTKNGFNYGGSTAIEVDNISLTLIIVIFDK